MGRSRESVEIIVKVKRFTCFIGNSIDCEAPEWLILMKPRWSPAQEQLEICQPRKPEARDKFAFPLNLAFPFLICCLYSLVFRTTAFFCRSVLDIWQNMHRDWTDKWFCAKAIFIHSFTFFRFSNANSILRNFQFCSPPSHWNRIGKAGGRFNKFRESAGAPLFTANILTLAQQPPRSVRRCSTDIFLAFAIPN